MAVDNAVWGDTLGDGKTGDDHAGKRFHYQLANPPLGVKGEAQARMVEKEITGKSGFIKKL